MAERDAPLIAMHRDKLRELHRRAAEAIHQLDDADVNWRPNEESNAIANLVIHLAGNLKQRLTAGIAGAPDTRDRDAEFNERTPLTRDQVLALWQSAVDEADGVLAALSPDRLDEPQQIRNRTVTVLDVLFTVATHMAEHVGQILYIAKLRRGSEYQVVSIPHAKR
ncbi:MAG: DUF1572 family protein [Bacillota bacterium]